MLSDEPSLYPVTWIVCSLAAVTMIPVVDEPLSLFGIPDLLKSDNGPPSTSDDFYKYSQYAGFQYWRIWPQWLRANSEVEFFMSNGNRSYIHSCTATVQLHMNCYSAGQSTSSCLSFQIFPPKIFLYVGGIIDGKAFRKTTVTPGFELKPQAFNLETLC